MSEPTLLWFWDGSSWRVHAACLSCSPVERTGHKPERDAVGCETHAATGPDMETVYFFGDMKEV